jgi:DNA helicase-2/ATP-dependent DNA helicase PcrA
MNERNIFGSIQANAPSRFLDDIPEHLLENVSQKTRSTNQGLTFYQAPQKSKPTELSRLSPANYKDGERVEHSVFGPGLIISVRGDILTIAFSKAGLKKLSAAIAPLKKI